MKNFRQTPRQRRAAKAVFAQQKHLVRTSSPIKVFEQQYCYNYYGGGKRNLVHHVDGRYDYVFAAPLFVFLWAIDGYFALRRLWKRRP